MWNDQRLRKSERLQRRKDYHHVFKVKCSAGDGVLVVYVANNGLEWSRLGLSVGKGVGNAVRRGYARRRIREAFRKAKNELPRGLDIVCIARHATADRKRDIGRCLCKLTRIAIRRLEAAAGNKAADQECKRA